MVIYIYILPLLFRLNSNNPFFKIVHLMLNKDRLNINKYSLVNLEACCITLHL